MSWRVCEIYKDQEKVFFKSIFFLANTVLQGAGGGGVLKQKFICRLT